MAKDKRVQARVTPLTRQMLDEIQEQTGENDAQWIARWVASEHRARFPEQYQEVNHDNASTD